MRGAPLAVWLTALLAFIVLPAVAEPAFTPGGQAQLRAVIDGATATLDDGRTLRLVGIDAPSGGALARQAKAALAELVAGNAVDLRFAGNPADRQGRVLAQIYAGPVWVQGELVRRGLARVRGTADNRPGIVDLLRIERQARRYHRGIWSDAAYAVRAPDQAATFAGTFQLVDGTIGAVDDVSGTIFLRFGADRQSAFAVSIAGPALKLCSEAGLDPTALAGKRILVRGYIDGTKRPTIALTYPEQIEILRAKKTAPEKHPGPR